MRTIFLFLFLFHFTSDSNLHPLPLDKIFSKNYYLTYSDESRLFVSFDSVGTTRIEKGILNRSENYMLSKSDSELGILEDSTCFIMDNSDSTISIGPKSFVGTMLLLPLFDPYEIVSYAIDNKMGFQKYVEDGRLTYDFISFKKDEPIISIVISFYDPNNFSIKLIYQQMNRLREDIIRYMFVARPSNTFHAKIADFLYFKSGKYSPKEAYKRYFFTNAYLILKKK